jgi:hypothetical protein
MPNDPTKSAWTKTWQPILDMAAPSGVLLLEVVRLMPEGSRITIFGSAPLQLSLDHSFLSIDMDCFGEENLQTLVADNGLDAKSRSPYVQVCSQLNFKTSPLWKDRAYSYPLEGRTVIIPHPIDILIGKLHRMEEKDMNAFKLVRDKTGHPTEKEMIEELQAAVDLYRPGFDEEKSQDLKTTTRMLWQEFFGKDIDPVKVIIAPALETRRAGYEKDVSQTDHLSALRRAGSQLGRR